MIVAQRLTALEHVINDLAGTVLVATAVVFILWGLEVAIDARELRTPLWKATMPPFRWNFALTLMWTCSLLYYLAAQRVYSLDDRLSVVSLLLILSLGAPPLASFLSWADRPLTTVEVPDGDVGGH